MQSMEQQQAAVGDFRLWLFLSDLNLRLSAAGDRFLELGYASIPVSET